MGPFLIVERIRPVAYYLELLIEFKKIHDFFHVSVLKKYVFNPSHILESPPIESQEDLNFVMQL